MSKFQRKEDFEKEVVRHVETTLARSMFNCDSEYVMPIDWRTRDQTEGAIAQRIPVPLWRSGIVW